MCHFGTFQFNSYRLLTLSMLSYTLCTSTVYNLQYMFKRKIGAHNFVLACVCVFWPPKKLVRICVRTMPKSDAHTHTFNEYIPFNVLYAWFVCVCNRCEILDHDGMLHNSVEVDSILYISWNGMEYWLNQNCREKKNKKIVQQ